MWSCMETIRSAFIVVSLSSLFPQSIVKAANVREPHSPQSLLPPSRSVLYPFFPLSFFLHPPFSSSPHPFTISTATSTSHQKCDWPQSADLLTVHWVSLSLSNYSHLNNPVAAPRRKKWGFLHRPPLALHSLLGFLFFPPLFHIFLSKKKKKKAQGRYGRLVVKGRGMEMTLIRFERGAQW